MKKTIALAALVSLCSCAGAGLVSPVRSFSTTDTVVLRSSPDSFEAVVRRAAQQTGWAVQGVDLERRTITLGSSLGGVGNALVGRIRITNLIVSLRPDGRTIQLQISVTGNLGAGREEAVTERLNAFKAALFESQG